MLLAFSFFVCKSRIIHKDPFSHIINNLIIMVIRLFKYKIMIDEISINIIYTIKYEIMDIIEDFTEFVKRINENAHLDNTWPL